IFTRARHSRPIIITVAMFVLAGTWLERYIWISGSVESRYFHTPLSDSFDLLVTGLIAIATVMSVRWMLIRNQLLEDGRVSDT
nr:hypothetical protein [Rhodospirillaceae bacterium]